MTRVRRLEESRERETGVGEPGNDIVPPHQRRAIAMGGEIGEIGLGRDEAIRLVMKPRDRDARHEWSERID